LAIKWFFPKIDKVADLTVRLLAALHDLQNKDRKRTLQTAGSRFVTEGEGHVTSCHVECVMNGM